MPELEWGKLEHDFAPQPVIGTKRRTWRCIRCGRRRSSAEWRAGNGCPGPLTPQEAAEQAALLKQAGAGL